MILNVLKNNINEQKNDIINDDIYFTIPHNVLKNNNDREYFYRCINRFLNRPNNNIFIHASYNNTIYNNTQIDNDRINKLNELYNLTKTIIITLVFKKITDLSIEDHYTYEKHGYIYILIFHTHIEQILDDWMNHIQCYKLLFKNLLFNFLDKIN